MFIEKAVSIAKRKSLGRFFIGSRNGKNQTTNKTITQRRKAMKKTETVKTAAVIVGVNHEVVAASAAKKAVPEKKVVTPKVQPSIEEVEKWNAEVYERVVARYLTEEDLVTQNERGSRFFVEKATIILAGRQVPPIVHRQYICAVEAQMAVLQAKVERESALVEERRIAALEASRKHLEEQKKKEVEVVKIKLATPNVVPASIVVPVGKTIATFTEEERILRDKLFKAEKLEMFPRGYAMKLDGLISSPIEAMVLNAGARFIFQGKVYILDDKTGKKVIKDFVGAKFCDEAKKSFSSAPAAMIKLPENLDQVYVTLESDQENRTFLVTVIPEDFSVTEAQKYFRPRALFAKKHCNMYQVWQRTKSSVVVIGACRKASVIEKREKRMEKKVETPKVPVRTVDLLATPMQLALQGAMQKKRGFARSAAMA